MLERSKSWSLNAVLMSEWKVRMADDGSSWMSVIEGRLKAGQSLVWGQRIVWTNIVMKLFIYSINMYILSACYFTFTILIRNEQRPAWPPPSWYWEGKGCRSNHRAVVEVQHGKAMEHLRILGKPTAGGLNPWRSSGKDSLQGMLHGVSPARWMGYIVAEDREA